MLYSRWGTWKNLPDQQNWIQVEEEWRRLTWGVFSQQRKLFSGLGRIEVGPHLLSPRVSLPTWFCILFTQRECSHLHRTGLFFNSHSFRPQFLLLLLFSVSNPSTWKFMKRECIIHQNCHIRLMKWLVLIIAHHVSPLFESFCLLIEYSKWFIFFHWESTKSKHNCRWELLFWKR